MPDLFKEIIPSIMHTKEDVFPDGIFTDYNPYIVNRALSYHRDTILYANLMNQNHGLDKNQQYAFYLNTIRKAKRPFKPWTKPEKDEHLEAVKIIFGYSNEKAKQTLKVLDDVTKNELLERVKKGGLKK